MEKKIAELKEHPKNKEIYSHIGDGELYESIKKVGILTPILINKDGLIIGGHRRYSVAVKLKLKTVPVTVVDLTDEHEILERLIYDNQYREKTLSQKMAEADLLKDIEKQRSKNKMGYGGAKGGAKSKRTKNKGVFQKNTPLKPKKKREPASRDSISKKVGLGSGINLSRADYIHQLAKKGNADAKGSMRKIDEKKSTITAEYNKLKKLEKASDEDYQKEQEEKKRMKYFSDTLKQLITVLDRMEHILDGNIKVYQRDLPTLHSIKFNMSRGVELAIRTGIDPEWVNSKFELKANKQFDEIQMKTIDVDAIVDNAE